MSFSVLCLHVITSKDTTLCWSDSIEWRMFGALELELRNGIHPMANNLMKKGKIIDVFAEYNVIRM